MSEPLLSSAVSLLGEEYKQMERIKLFSFTGFGGLMMNAELYLYTKDCLEKVCFLDIPAM